MTQVAVVQYALEPLAVELRDVAVPEIGDDDVLLRVGAVSVCGSDIHQAYNAMCVNSTIRPGDLVVVLGPGPIGLLCARMAALSGADPLIVVGLSADSARLETARRLGATHVVDAQRENLDEVVRDLNPLGADLVCDASGASRPLDVALALARPGGQVTKVGWSPDLVPVNVNPLVQENV